MLQFTKPRALLLLAAGALLGCAAAGLVRAQTGEKAEVIVLTVRLPGDAVLFIDDHKTQETGDARTFRTPPLPMGKHYAYTLRATSNGKEVARKIHLAHGVDNVFDLRAEFLPAAVGKIHPKQFTSSAAPETSSVYGIVIWGASRQTLEKAFDPQPPDGSKFPK